MYHLIAHIIHSHHSRVTCSLFIPCNSRIIQERHSLNSIDYATYVSFNNAHHSFVSITTIIHIFFHLSKHSHHLRATFNNHNDNSATFKTVFKVNQEFHSCFRCIPSIDPRNIPKALIYSNQFSSVSVTSNISFKSWC